MKRVAFFLVVSVITCILCGCGRKKHVEPNGYVWYEIKSDGLVGAEDAQGNKLLPCEYEAISLDTFITSHPSRTFMPSTEYFWRWDAAEAFCKNINLCITTKQINSIDTVRYSTVTYLDDTLMTPWRANDNKLEKVYRIVVKDENFKTIYECYKSHFSSAAYCLYNNDDLVFRHAPELNRKVLFGGCDFYPKYCIYLFNGKGQMIIPPERNYTGYAAYHIENGCFFIASTGKQRYQDQDPYAILSSNGEELFRVDCRTLYCPTWHVEHNDRGIFTFENYIGIDINEDGSIEMVYDDNKGFGVFQKPIKNPYKLGNWGRVGEDELYWDWERKYGEKEMEMIQNPKILWTGIKIPEYSSTFDVEPGNDNRQGKLVDLYQLATQRKKASTSSDVYTPIGGTYVPTGYSGNIGTTSNSTSASTTQKRWHNVTRTENCPLCHGTGRCSTCNGKGYYYNPYGTGTVTCPNCHYGRCSKCGGTGTITKTEQVYE